MGRERHGVAIVASRTDPMGRRADGTRHREPWKCAPDHAPEATEPNLEAWREAPSTHGCGPVPIANPVATAAELCRNEAPGRTGVAGRLAATTAASTSAADTRANRGTKLPPNMQWSRRRSRSNSTSAYGDAARLRVRGRPSLVAHLAATGPELHETAARPAGFFGRTCASLVAPQAAAEARRRGC